MTGSEPGEGVAAPAADAAQGAAPLLRVVRGRPEPAEVAALVAVVMSRGTAADAQAGSGRVSVWASRARHVRPPLRPGRGAWRTSSWPR